MMRGGVVVGVQVRAWVRQVGRVGLTVRARGRKGGGAREEGMGRKTPFSHFGKREEGMGRKRSGRKGYRV